jgi:hypothetical protein
MQVARDYMLTGTPAATTATATTATTTATATTATMHYSGHADGQTSMH